MFERLYEIPGMSVDLLCEQYRMLPCISCFPSVKFYEGMLVDRVAERKPPVGYQWPSHLAVAFEQCWGFEEKHSDENSIYNMREARRIVQIAADLIFSKEVRACEISILTPYRGQVNAIRTYSV